MLVITKDNFELEVMQAEKTVVLDFWATWCGPCRMLAPVVEALEKRFETICFGKVNVDEEYELAMQFGVQSIPTLVVLKDGKEVTRWIGYREEKNLAEKLESFQ